MMTRSNILALAFTVLFGAGALAQAGHSGGCTCGQFQTKPIPWQIDHGSTEYQNAAAAEFARWNSVANLFSAAVGDGSASSNNGRNEIVFVENTLDADTFGVCLISPGEAFDGSPSFDDCSTKQSGTICGTFAEADVLINSDFADPNNPTHIGFTPFGPPDFDDADGPAYYGATALHEVGHALGLHHNFRNLSTMNYYEDYAGQYLSVADAMAVRAAYPGQVKAMTDMATYPFYYDPTAQKYSATAPISFSPASVNAGGTITVSNVTVENVGTTSLSNVKLQFYLSTDSTITPSDILLATVTYDSFASTAYDDQPFPDIPIPTSILSGDYFVGARVLRDGTSEDSITYNNTWSSPDRLKIAGSEIKCESSGADLFLQNGRFRVELCAKDPRTGKIGPGVATKFNEIVGYFSVTELTSDPTNFEVFVKVLDGTSINGNYWVFYGGLTDFALTIRITDLQTGKEKTYLRPGREYGGYGDTRAF